MLIFVNDCLPKFLANSYYSYHYNCLTDQLLDDLTKYGVSKNERF